MEVHLTPNQEAFIQQRVSAGVYATQDEAVQAAVALLEEQESSQDTVAFDGLVLAGGVHNLVEVCAMVRGLTEDVDFSRDPSADRPLDLS